MLDVIHPNGYNEKQHDKFFDILSKILKIKVCTCGLSNQESHFALFSLYDDMYNFSFKSGYS